nr:GAP family protein [Arthrobacter jiangjiafuii]
MPETGAALLSRLSRLLDRVQELKEGPWHPNQLDIPYPVRVRPFPAAPLFCFETARAWEFAVLGLGLNLRPKAILLAVAAGTMIGVRGQPPIEAAMLVLAYAAVAQSAVVVPIGIWLRSPDRAQDHLRALAAWMQRNGRTITAIVVLLIGVFLLGYNLLQLP